MMGSFGGLGGRLDLFLDFSLKKNLSNTARKMDAKSNMKGWKLSFSHCREAMRVFISMSECMVVDGGHPYIFAAVAMSFSLVNLFILFLVFTFPSFPLPIFHRRSAG